MCVSFAVGLLTYKLICSSLAVEYLMLTNFISCVSFWRQPVKAASWITDVCGLTILKQWVPIQPLWVVPFVSLPLAAPALQDSLLFLHHLLILLFCKMWQADSHLLIIRVQTITLVVSIPSYLNLSQIFLFYSSKKN